MPEIGQTIPHYEITSEIGKGGIGEVYQTTDTKLGRNGAIKGLPPERVANASRKARFVQEAKAASALNHLHIVYRS